MNTCGIHMTFVGDKDEIGRLHKFFSTAVAAKKARLTDMMKSVGISGEDPVDNEIFRVENIEETSDEAIFSVVGCSSQVFFEDIVMTVVSKVAPNVEMFYTAEEPMLGFFETNDKNGRFYPTRKNAA